MVNGSVMYALAKEIGVYYLLAQVVATALVLIMNYLANALWTFGGKVRAISK